MDAKRGNEVRVTVDNAKKYVEGVLVGNGVKKENAAIVANCLVQADLRGVDTHGINRIPSYMTRVRQGALDLTAEPKLEKITPVVAQVNSSRFFAPFFVRYGC